MATAIVSVMTGIPVRRDVAMTGEITLRGRVLPIGGLKEKLLAALRGGMKTVLIPEENAKDLADIPDSVKNGLEIVPVSRMDEVLTHALVRQPVPIVWEEGRQACDRLRAAPGRRGRPGTGRALKGVKARMQTPRPDKGRGVFLLRNPLHFTDETGYADAGPTHCAGPGAVSSVGRASRLHREGRRFEPVTAHHFQTDLRSR